MLRPEPSKLPPVADRQTAAELIQETLLPLVHGFWSFLRLLVFSPVLANFRDALHTLPIRRKNHAEVGLPEKSRL